jgi:hypothetical protein
MKRIIPIFVILLVWFSIDCQSQEHTINGFISSAETGESLVSATLFDSINYVGTVSNASGYFSIKLPEGLVSLKATYLGYQGSDHCFFLSRDTTLQVKLYEKAIVAGTVVITSSIPVHKQVLMGMTNVPIKTIEAVPSFTGQPDLLKAITFIPGFSGGREGYSNIMVRGGDRGQNLILLDGIKLYNTSHLGGFVSLFNTDVVKQVDLYKGGFPARYGGRLSSVINVVSRGGDKNKLGGRFSIGLLSSSFSLDGPIGDKITFLLSVRSAYFDLILLPVKLKAEKNKKGGYWMCNFYDINAKMVFQPSLKNKWTLNFYQGNDRLKAIDYSRSIETFVEDIYTINTLNQAASLMNNRSLSSKLFLKSNFTVSGYNNKFFEKMKHTGPQINDMKENLLKSDIREISAQSRLEYYASAKQTIMVGAEYSNYLFTPMIQNSISENYNTGFENDTTIGYSEPINSNELSFFAEDDIKFSGSTYLNIGIRGTSYFCEGANHMKFDPRISLRTMLNDNLSFKANYTMMHQFNHVVINNVSGMEREFWLASSKDIPPQSASQWSAGLFGTLPDKNLELSAELYYKTMSNLLEFRFSPGEEFHLKNFSDIVIKDGKGEAYGGEFQMKYSTEKLLVDLGYTLSWNNRQFDSLNNGNTYPYLFDRRHNLSLFAQLKLSNRYLLSSNFVFSTGTPVTFPDGYVKSDGYALGYYVYSGINNRRLPNYHRLDLALIRKSVTKNGNKTQWCLNIFNVYAHQNPVFIYYKTGTGKVHQKSNFSIIPSISYSFEF